MDIWEDLGDLATESVGIQLQRRRKCGLNTIASGVRAKQNPGFCVCVCACVCVCVLKQHRVWLQKVESTAANNDSFHYGFVF